MSELAVAGGVINTGTGRLLPAGRLYPAVATRRRDAGEVMMDSPARHAQIVALSAGLKPAITAVVHPCDTPSLSAAVEAAQAGLILPVLVGPEAKIRAVAAAANLDIRAFRLVAAPHSHAAAAEAVAMAGRGEAEALMKGSLHTDELMHAVVADKAMATGRRISHCYLFDVTSYPRPLFITDAAINIFPKLSEKHDICQNAIDFAVAMGVVAPKVAILSAVELVTEKMPATIDAAALCKMAERGQITGGMLDGPLAFDNAVNMEAARIKGIVSPVAGQADILLVPDIESGNMLAKQLTFFEGGDGAGIVLGARLPIILTSRADPASTRLASCAIALLLVQVQPGVRGGVMPGLAILTLNAGSSSLKFALFETGAAPRRVLQGAQGKIAARRIGVSAIMPPGCWTGQDADGRCL